MTRISMGASVPYWDNGGGRLGSASRARSRSRTRTGLENWVAERLCRHAGNADVVRQEPE